MRALLMVLLLSWSGLAPASTVDAEMESCKLMAKAGRAAYKLKAAGVTLESQFALLRAKDMEEAMGPLILVVYMHPKITSERTAYTQLFEYCLMGVMGK